MHSDALPPPHSEEPGWGGPVGLALAVHLLVALIFIVAWLWSPQRNTEAAAGDPAVQADMALSSAEASAARQALRQSERLETLPEPIPEPIPEPVPEDTVPPPQPLPEPRPMDAPTPQQQQAQERIAQPDKVDQEAVNALAISQEKAKQEQEAKRRQEQIDLTERQRQEEAEQKARLARQQEAEQKRVADQERRAAEANEEAQKQKRIAELRSRREAAEREAKQAEARLRQVTAARNAAANAGSTGATTPASGAGGTSNDLAAKYAAAIQAKVTAAWIRPENIPTGQRCQITITQLNGGRVLRAQVSGNCPYDEAGKRSIEAAVLNAQPLPYAGFESVFNRTLILNFSPD